MYVIVVTVPYRKSEINVSRSISLTNAQDLLKAYFHKVFSHWVETRNLPSKLLVKVDERKMPCLRTTLSVVDARFFNTLYEIERDIDVYKVVLDPGAVQFHELAGVKVSVLKASFHYGSVLRELTSGMQNIHVGLAATETYSFERSVYGYWLHDLNDNDFELYFNFAELNQFANNLAGSVTQRLFFDGEAKKRWDAVGEHERYAAIGVWAAETDLS